MRNGEKHLEAKKRDGLEIPKKRRRMVTTKKKKKKERGGKWGKGKVCPIKSKKKKGEWGGGKGVPKPTLRKIFSYQEKMEGCSKLLGA